MSSDITKDVSMIEFYQMSDSPHSPEEAERQAREVLQEALDTFPDRRFQLWVSLEVASVERGVVLVIPQPSEKLGDFGSYEEAVTRLNELTGKGVVS